MKEKLKSTKGITLIALVVTIIILIILAGVSINLVFGQQGIITRAKGAEEATKVASVKEQIQLDILSKQEERLEKGAQITQGDIEEILSKYGTVNKNDDEVIESLTLTDKNYKIPFEEIYNGTLPEPEPTMAAKPEKSENPSFSRANGVIEIEFLKGTGYTTTTTPNVPNMGTNMKKVYWEADGTERIEGQEGFDATKWYNYEAQEGATTSGGTSKWANAVTVDSDGNITGYFVWIPRYAYRIVYFDSSTNEENYRTNGTTTGIVGYSDARGFVDLDGKTPSDMTDPETSISIGKNKLRPHPAFENGSEIGYTQGEWNTALEGIWIAKYETSGSSSALKSVPGVQALKNITIGNMYTYALNFDVLNKSHMLKNSEWGAMAYLTESKYGRNGTAVSRNTNTSCYTAGSSGATVASNPLQSTTGNYYGIYDTAGGSCEYVAGYIADGSQNYGNSFASTADTFNNKETSTEYATVYKMLSSSAIYAENYNQNINQKFGDAIIETSTAGGGLKSWDSASSVFVGVSNFGDRYPFFTRGGHCNNITYAGSFNFGVYTGNSYGTYSFRLCLPVK